MIADPEICGAGLTCATFRRDLLAGLSRPAKAVPCKYFYDEQGARLFELICELEEYYPTRTEMGILRDNLEEIARVLGAGCQLVDLGSGSGLKTRLLLDALERPASCVLVDVAREQLLQSAADLGKAYPGLTVLPVCADYTSKFALRFDGAAEMRPSGRTVAFFPGSTIGNFEPAHAISFLRRIARMCGPEGGLLVGVDLKKSPAVLNPAYNDSQGVTAAFNLNVLARANRELGGRFDLSGFRHQAFYNERAGRIEMHLVSRRSQVVPVDGATFSFARGESILTEHSYKYTVPEFHALAARAGLQAVRCWVDERQWFSIHFLKPRFSSLSPVRPNRRR